MKAHIKTRDEKIVEYENDLIMRTLKIACITLREEFGFGQQRLEKFCCKMCEAGSDLSKNPHKWYHIDKKLIEDYGLKEVFKPEDLDEREMSAREIRKKYRL